MKRQILRKSPLKALGLMSGTSLDGIDGALLSFEPNKEFNVANETLFQPYEHAQQICIQNAFGSTEHSDANEIITQSHITFVSRWIEHGFSQPDIIGFHGQTILHEPKDGRTVQIGDPQLIANATGIPIVADLRLADVAHGGQGAPLVPVYHNARLKEAEKPTAIVNIGGVSNITYMDGENLIAFDCGPGNAPLNDWMRAYCHKSYDENGSLAQTGHVQMDIVKRLLLHPYFAVPPPKSLDRNTFPILQAVQGMTKANGAATITVIVAATIAESSRWFPRLPERWLISGGGRHNATLVQMLRSLVKSRVDLVEEIGWNGDMLEAEAFAYLAVCHLRELPITFPSTTGVQRPLTGGVLYLPNKN